MNKSDAKKVIECAVVPQASDICGECPACSHCNYGLKDCEKHVHEAAKVLYGGCEEDRSMSNPNLNKEIVFDAKNNRYSVSVGFEFTDEFLSCLKQNTDK
jgi:hypothetical protein